MPTKATAAAVVGISSGVISLPGSIMVNATAYQASKVGMTKMLETFGMENPDMHVSIIHPGKNFVAICRLNHDNWQTTIGIIDTEMMDKSGRKGMMKADTSKHPPLVNLKKPLTSDRRATRTFRCLVNVSGSCLYLREIPMGELGCWGAYFEEEWDPRTTQLDCQHPGLAMVKFEVYSKMTYKRHSLM